MNQISIAICDADSAYGNKLAEYLLETGNVAKAEVYTDWNSVEADLNEEKRDIWLINSGLLKEAETLPLKKEMVWNTIVPPHSHGPKSLFPYLLAIHPNANLRCPSDAVLIA